MKIRSNDDSKINFSINTTVLCEAGRIWVPADLVNGYTTML